MQQISSYEFQLCTFFLYRYETSSEVLDDIDCTKRAVCEVYQNSNELGEFGQRAVHGFDMMESWSEWLKLLPGEFLNTLLLITLYENTL